MSRKPSAIATKAALRRAEATKLRAEGYSNEEIKDDLGYASVAGVRADIRRHLRENGREEAKELLDLEMMRLDHLQKGLTEGFDNGDLALADPILRVMTRRANYIGLDAGNREDDYSDVDRWLAGVVDGDEPNLDPDDILGEELEVEELDDGD